MNRKMSIPLSSICLCFEIIVVSVYVCTCMYAGVCARICVYELIDVCMSLYMCMHLCMSVHFLYV